MPDWKKILQEIAVSAAQAADESSARNGRSTSKRGSKSTRTYKANTCLFWDCKKRIRDNHVFCYEHFQGLQAGKVDECPGCGFAKDAQYETCLDCRNNGRRSSAKGSKGGGRAKSWYKPEYSPQWKARDAKTTTFYVYLLKLDDGHFYAGQTRELRERLSEHRDGHTKSTAGRNPKLVWFGVLPSREAATSTGVELKKLVDSNLREIRRMVIGFKDLVQELDYS